MATEYGTRLRTARKLRGLTQIDLSKATGIPQSTISTAEREGTKSLETTTYATALKVRPEWLASGEGDMEPTGILARLQADLPVEGWTRTTERQLITASSKDVVAWLKDALQKCSPDTRQLVVSTFGVLGSNPTNEAAWRQFAMLLDEISGEQATVNLTEEERKGAEDLLKAAREADNYTIGAKQRNAES